MAKKPQIQPDAEGLYAIKVTELVTVGVARMARGRVYRVDEQTLDQLGDKWVPADG